MSSAIFRTGLRAPHVVLADAMVPADPVLVTPALTQRIINLTPPPLSRRTKELSPNSEMERYASFALDSLKKTRTREHVPAQEEIRAIVARQEMTTMVHCHGGGSCKITINSHTTAGEVGADTLMIRPDLRPI